MTSRRILRTLAMLFVAGFVLVLAGRGPHDTEAPAVQQVFATSSTSLLVALNRTAAASALPPTRFRIRAADGSFLPVLGSYSLGGGKVALATGRQRSVAYTLRLTSRGNGSAEGVALTFRGGAEPGPVLERAVALDRTHIRLAFARSGTGAPVTLGESVLSPSRYRVTRPDLRVESAAFGTGPAGRSQVVLTTAPMTARGYVVTVRGVATGVRGVLVDPTRSTLAVSYGSP